MTEFEQQSAIYREFCQLPQGQHLSRLLEFLASDNQAKNVVASTFLTKLGPQVVHTLIIEAMAKRRGPKQVVRFLDVVEAIGAPLSPNDFFAVGTLMRSPHAIVREKIAQLMIKLR